MLLEEDKELDIFVASRIGSFKHIKYHTDSTKNNKKCIENLVEIKTLQKDDTVTCLEWGNAEQTEILLGRKNQQVQLYDTLQGFTKSYAADFAAGELVGLGRCRRKLLAAVSSGAVRIWSKKTEVLVDSGGKLDTMRVCADEPTVFATGGEENDLKIWKIGDVQPTFSAKNLPHDQLQLRQPVWVADVCFLPGAGGRLVAVCSRHGYVRLYDARAQRRPVSHVMFPNMAATCIAAGHRERQVFVGFGRGQLHQVDLRRARPDKGYKGCAGAVTSIALAGGVVVSASLDRHVRVHDRDTKELLYKQYLTSKLCRVLVQSASRTPLRGDVKDEPKAEEDAQPEVDDLDQLFDSMETVREKPKKKIIIEVTPSKRMKPSIEGSTIDVEDLSDEDQDNKEEAIAKLLKSTEKQKKRMEKRKREKKAKSVFHNA